MKKNLLNMLAALAMLATIASCAGDDSDNPNVIVDDTGVNLEITWANNATDPTVGTSLELLVKDGSLPVFRTNNWHSFGSVDIHNGSLNNGTYDLDVRVDDIDLSTNYTITVTGLSTGKSYATSFGPINANDLYSTLQPLSLTISGNKFTVVN